MLPALLLLTTTSSVAAQPKPQLIYTTLYIPFQAVQSMGDPCFTCLMFNANFYYPGAISAYAWLAGCSIDVVCSFSYSFDPSSGRLYLGVICWPIICTGYIGAVLTYN